jgi:hypothetical protein
MPTVEVSRTLVKSPPELWEELQGDCLPEALGGGTVRTKDPDRELEWETDGARGTAVIEASGWGTKVTFTAEIEEEVARLEPEVASVGFWERLRAGEPPAPAAPPEPARAEIVETALEKVLDDLGAAHKKPFQNG